MDKLVSIAEITKLDCFELFGSSETLVINYLNCLHKSNQTVK